ncbi:MAG: hypothetical protein QOF89_4367 [Acidobacteriota bacterium]|jgi:hypothetical protein|nr:hypothetical protein [Acidobacteriota bacterium]
MTVQDLKVEAKALEAELKRLLVEFEARTGFRVSEIRRADEGPEPYDQEVYIRLDPLPHPERLPVLRSFYGPE